jgi:hypothetical protein
MPIMDALLPVVEDIGGIIVGLVQGGAAAAEADRRSDRRDRQRARPGLGARRRSWCL